MKMKRGMRGLMLLLFILAVPLVFAANDPGHDTLYIEESGEQNLTGSFNISDWLRVANLFYSDYLDIQGNGTQPGNSRAEIYATAGNGLYFNAPGNFYFGTGDGTMVYIGTSGVSLNVSSNIYAGGVIYQDDVAVCLSNGTNCISGTNEGNVTSIIAGNGISVDQAIGDVTVSTNAATCSGGQYSYWDGNSWECGTISGSSSAGGWTNTSTVTSTDLHVNITTGNLTVINGDLIVGKTTVSAGLGANSVIESDDYIVAGNNKGFISLTSGGTATTVMRISSSDHSEYFALGDTIFYSDSTQEMIIKDGGTVGIGPNNDPGAQLDVQTESNAVKGLVVQGAASQNANLTEWQNSTGDALAYVDAAGDLFAQDGQVCTAANGLCNQTEFSGSAAGGDLSGTYPNPSVRDDSHELDAANITSGTLAIARGGTGAATTSQNYAFIGPTSGGGAPSFRALVDGDIPDTITASNYVRTSTWTDHDNYPSACGAGEAVQGLGDTLTCISLSSSSSASGWTNTSTLTSTDLNVNITSGNLTVSGGFASIGTDILNNELEVSGSTSGNIFARVTNLNTLGESGLVLGETLDGATPFYMQRYGSTDASRPNDVEFIASGSGADIALMPTDYVGIGTTDPNTTLHVAGDINVTAGNDICINGDTCLGIVAAADGNVSGSGTASYVPYWSDGAENLGDSNALFDGSNFDIASGNLEVGGTTRISSAGAGTFASASLSGDIDLNSNDLSDIGNLYTNDASGNFFSGGCSNNEHITGISSSGVISCAANSGSSAAGGWTNNSQNTTTTLDVGIGTTNPEAALHVSGGDILLDNTYSIRWDDSGGTPTDIITLSAADNLAIDAPSGGDFYFNGASTFALKSGGNVGIGQVTPLAKLHVQGTADDEVVIVRAFSSQTANLQEWQNSTGSALAYVDPSGDLFAQDGQVCTAANGLCNQTEFSGSAAGGDLSGTYPDPSVRDDSHELDAANITSGTLAIARGGTGAATTSQNYAFIGPTSGGGAPSFRALVDGDIPDTITASNYVRTSTWTDHDNYPSACGAGTAVQGIGDTLSCISLGSSSAGGWTNTSTYTYTNLEVNVSDFFWANSTAVGIGTKSPQADLHILATGTAGTPSIASNFVVQRSGVATHNARMALISGNDANSLFYFGDTDSEIRGRLMYNHSGDALSLWTASARALTIDSSQRVGIGTNSPETLLHLLSDNPIIRLNDSTDDSEMQIRLDSGVFEIGDGSLAPLRIETGAPSNAFYIEADGDIGFGTTNPEQPIDIEGTTAAIRLNDTDGSYAYDIKSTGTVFQISRDGSGVNELVMDNVGNVTVYTDVCISGGKCLGSTGTGSGSVSGTGTQNYLTKWSAGGADIEDSAIYESGGSVGIGTANPSTILDVVGSTDTSTALLVLNNTGDSGNLIKGFNDLNRNIFAVNQNGAGDGLINLANASEDITVKLVSNGDSYFTGGNVGIGTSSPSYPLEVTDTATNILINGTSTGLLMVDRDATADQRFMQLMDNDGKFYIRALDDSYALTYNGFVLDMSNGYVGIGTDSPSKTLELAANDVRLLFNDTSSSGALINDWQITINDADGGSANKFAIDDLTGGTTPLIIENATPSNTLYIDRAGYIGIGTNNPSEALDIVGNFIKIDNNADAGGGLVIDTGSTASQNSQIIFRDQGSSDWYLRKTTNNDFDIYSGDYGDTVFFIDNTTGNIGIRTSDPSQDLHVHDSAAANIYVNSSGANANVLIDRGDSTDEARVMFYTDGSALVALGLDSNSDNYHIGNSGFATKWMTINTTTGYVGIGTSTPDNMLNLEGTDGRVRFTDTDTRAILDLMNNISTPAADTEGGRVNFMANDANGNPTVYGRIAGWVADDTESSEDGYLTFHVTNDGTNSPEVMRILDSGYVGIGTTQPNSTLHVQGNINVSGPGNIYYEGNLTGYGADIAEKIFAHGELEAGDVVIISNTGDETVELSWQAYDTRVAGIVSTDPSHLISADAGDVPLALSGRVPVKVTMENGAIARGDLLTTSSTPGHAMRCSSRIECTGAIVGKALESLNTETGLITALVVLG